MTGNLDPEERVLDALLIQELEAGPIEVGPGRFALRHDDFLGDLVKKMEQLGMTADVPLEVVIGGSQIYEIEGSGTRWAPTKGTVKYNDDAFIVIRRPKPVVSSVPPTET